MKKTLILVLFVSASFTTVYTQKPSGQFKPPLPVNPSPNPPPPMTPPIFPATEAERTDRSASFSVALLPAVPQDAAFTNLKIAFENGAVRVRMSENKMLNDEFTEAEADFQKIASRKGKPLPNLLLWTLNQDARLVQYYAQGGEAKYARVAFKHVHSVANSDAAADEATVTVITVDKDRKERPGYVICFLPAEWADLAVKPLSFIQPSGSSQPFPKTTNWVFWSQDILDGSKVGSRSPAKKIDKDETVSIGIPPS